MIKNFCDICGEPALSDSRVGIQINAGKPWSGTRPDSPVDGTWQPVVTLDTTFQLENGRKPADRRQEADLCAACRSHILQELLNKYAAPEKETSI